MKVIHLYELAPVQQLVNVEYLCSVHKLSICVRRDEARRRGVRVWCGALCTVRAAVLQGAARARARARAPAARQIAAAGPGELVARAERGLRAAVQDALRVAHVRLCATSPLAKHRGLSPSLCSHHQSRFTISRTSRVDYIIFLHAHLQLRRACWATPPRSPRTTCAPRFPRAAPRRSRSACTRSVRFCSYSKCEYMQSLLLLAHPTRPLCDSPRLLRTIAANVSLPVGFLYSNLLHGCLNMFR